MATNAVIYQTGNEWQKAVYEHMAEYFDKKGITSHGQSIHGNKYKHLLTMEDAKVNFLNDEKIFEFAKKTIKEQKAGDLNRILTNASTSQPYFFNMFFYLKNNQTLANAVFTELFKKEVVVEHIELEFTPNKMEEIKGFERKDKDESLGDQTAQRGTDADVAVFYTYDKKKKGVLLIEFKFIEAAFNPCSSYKNKKSAKAICDSPAFYKQMIEEKICEGSKKYLCGYHKFQHWTLTHESSVFNVEAIKKSKNCPLRFGLNKLWRNMLLAEKVADARKCNEFGVWVFSAKENDEFLWNQENENVEGMFKNLIKSKNSNIFRKIYLEDIFDLIQAKINEESDKEWFNKMKEKYSIEVRR